MEKNVENEDFENKVDDSHQLTLEVQGRSEKTIMTMTILNKVDDHKVGYDMMMTSINAYYGN